MQAADLLGRAQDATAREKDLLKSVPETEVISAMIGNVKLAMPGLSKMVTEQRKGRKKKGLKLRRLDIRDGQALGVCSLRDISMSI